MQTPDSISNLGILDTSKAFKNDGLLTTDTYTFEVKGRSSFKAILSSSAGDANLKLTQANSANEFSSSNPGTITDGITRILEPGTYTLTVSNANEGGTNYNLLLDAEPGIASSIVWRNSLSDETAFWDLDRSSRIGGAFVNNTPSLGSNSDWKLISAVTVPQKAGDRILVWRNAVSDETALWLVDSQNNRYAGEFIDKAPKLGSNSNWQLIDANLVNNNLRLLWRDAVSDQTGYWTIDDSLKVINSGLLTNTAALGSNSDWKLLDELILGDKTQLVWRNAATSETAYWTVNASGAVVDRGFFDAPKVGGDWELTKVAQVGNDPQFIWRNRATNEMAAWFFDGTKFSSGTFIDAPKVGKEWQIASVTSQYAEPQPMSLGGSSIDAALNLGMVNKAVSFTDSILPGSSNFYAFTVEQPELFAVSAQGLKTKLLDADGKEFTLGLFKPLAPGKYYFQVTNTNTTTATATINAIANVSPKISLADATSGTYEQSKGSAPILTATPSIVDPDSTELSLARVSITNLKNGADEKLTYDEAGSPIIGKYDAETGVLTLSGSASIADYQAALKRISYSNTALNPDKSDRLFSITVNDVFTDSAAVTTTMKLSFNTAPSLNADVSLGSILEQTTSNSSPTGETIASLLNGQFSDPDPNSSLKGIAIVENTASTSQGKWQYSPDGNNWQDVGSASETNALILSATTKLRFVPAAFYNGTPNGLTVRAIDNTYTGDFSTVTTGEDTTLFEPERRDVTSNGGVSPFSSTTKSIGTSVLSVNQAPTFNLSQNNLTVDVGAGTQTVNAFLTDITKGAANEANQTLSYDVQVDKSELFAANGQPKIDPATGTLTYTPSGITGTATITVTLKDNGGTANGGSDTTSKTFTIGLTDNTPVVSLTGATSGTYEQSKGSAQVLGGTLSISDRDSTQLESAKVKITNFKDGADEILAYAQNGSSITGNYDAATGVLTLSGKASIADYQAALQRISYSNKALNPDRSDRTFAITVNDGTADSAAVTTTLKLSFNTAPSLKADITLPSILELTSPSFMTGETISTLLKDQFSDPDANSSLKGIAIVGYTTPTTQGWWDYSMNGTDWFNLGTVSESKALILSATTKLRFQPAQFYNGTPDSLTIRVVDDTYTGGFSSFMPSSMTPPVSLPGGGMTGGMYIPAMASPVFQDVTRNGGVSAFSGTTNTIGITVLPVNQAPAFQIGGDQTVDVGAGAQTVNAFLTGVTKGAPNESTQTLNYSVQVDKPELFAANGQPSIDPATGTLTYTPLGIIGTATITVTLKDNGGTANGGSDTTSKTFTIGLTNNHDWIDQ